jgi:hypothetical protein
MNINPVANGNKTAAGVALTGGSVYAMAAYYLLKRYGVDEQTVVIIISALPGAALTVWGVVHKIVKAGGFVGMWRWFKANIIGAGK